MNLFNYLNVDGYLLNLEVNEKSDCFVCLAFGRNDIKDQDLNCLGFMVKELGDSKMIEIIKKNSFDPGLPNIRLANRVQELMLQYSLPALLQWEIVVALDNGFYEKHKDQIFIIWPSKTRKKGFNSKQVVEKAIEIMNDHNFEFPVFLAHELHLKRVLALWEGITEKEANILNSFVFDFDPKSIQKCTRSKRAWLKKEFLVRIHHLILRWV